MLFGRILITVFGAFKAKSEQIKGTVAPVEFGSKFCGRKSHN
jgi:hypothetical protein